MFGTFTIGMQDTADDILRSLTSQGIQHGFHVPGTFMLTDPQRVESVVLTPKVLGLEAGGTFEEICNLALSARYRLCPPELGPIVRVAYPDQKPGLEHTLYVAMEPLLFFEERRDGSGKYQRQIIWALTGGNFTPTGYDGKLWFHGRLVYPGAFFPPHAQFLFLK